MSFSTKFIATAALIATPIAGAIAMPSHSASAVQVPVSLRLAEAPLQMVEASGLQSERSEMEATFAEWQRKVEEAGDDLQNYAENATEEARDAATEAWAELQIAWQDVEDASEENWAAAKAKFDESTDRMEAAWKELTKE